MNGKVTVGIFLLLLLVSAGCFGSNQRSYNFYEDQIDNKSQNDLCSNQNYSTHIRGRHVVLTDNSSSRLRQKIRQQGSRAVEGITDLQCLTHLDLSETPLTDIAPIANLTDLKELDLHSTQVKDIGPLAGLTKLRGLDLKGVPVRDVSTLYGLERLGLVILEGTPVPTKQCLELKQKLPRAKIYCPTYNG